MKSLVLVLVAVACANAGRSNLLPHPIGRIAGGEEVAPNSVPFQAALHITKAAKTAFCGGSLIDPEWIITTASCTTKGDKITVTMGAHNISDATEAGQQVREAVEIIPHSAWDPQALTDDIALIKVDSPFNITESVKPINLPVHSESDQNFAGRDATITGWGETDNATKGSDVLQGAVVPVITNQQCRVEFGLSGIGIPIHPNNVCTSGVDIKNPCTGDDGGPLYTIGADNRDMLIGLTSYGSKQGCQKGFPHVYTRITSFLDWITLQSGIPIAP